MYSAQHVACCRWLPDETIDIKHLFKQCIVKEERNRKEEKNEVPLKCWKRLFCISFVDRQFDDVAPDKSQLV